MGDDTRSLEEHRDAILTKLYEEAEPGLDWNDVLENPDDYPDDFYINHTLSGDRQKEIFDNYVDNHDLDERTTSHLSILCILDYGPASFETGDTE